MSNEECRLTAACILLTYFPDAATRNFAGVLWQIVSCAWKLLAPSTGSPSLAFGTSNRSRVLLLLQT